MLSRTEKVATLCNSFKTMFCVILKTTQGGLKIRINKYLLPLFRNCYAILLGPRPYFRRPLGLKRYQRMIKVCTRVTLCACVSASACACSSACTGACNCDCACSTVCACGCAVAQRSMLVHVPALARVLVSSLVSVCARC